MNRVSDLLILLLFACAAIALARLDWRERERPRRITAGLVGASVGSVLLVTLVAQSPGSLGRAVLTAGVLGALPIAARILHPDGFDVIDVLISVFAGFVLGSTSWSLALASMIGAAAVSGTLAAIDLVRTNDNERRVPFGEILVVVSVVLGLTL
jgi:hypothetical protein